MKVFVLDTTRKVAKIDIFDDLGGQFSVSMDKNVRHSEGLFLYIEKLLCESKLQLDDIDVFSAIVGPGSFTGIRIGLATIKGFNKALKKKTIAITNFDVLSKFTKNGIILLDSTINSCYYAEIKGGKIICDGVMEKSQIIDFAEGRQIIILDEEQKTFNLEYDNIKVVGDTTEKLKEIIFDNIANENYSSLNPCYLQVSQAERNLK